MPSLDKKGTSVAPGSEALKRSRMVFSVSEETMSCADRGADIRTERNNVVNVFFIGIK